MKDTEFTVNLSPGLQAACAELGWNATRLAAESGVTERAASAWLRGTAAPSGDRLMALIYRNMVVRDHLLRAAA